MTILVMEPMGKRCLKCGVWKPLTDFHKNRATKDGLQAYCKPCMIQTVKESQARHWK